MFRCRLVHILNRVKEKEALFLNPIDTIDAIIIRPINNDNK